MMRHVTITTTRSILVNRPREVVWDFTQNYALRQQWDSSVAHTSVIQSTPTPIVRVKLRGGIALTYVYKLFDRPRKTSLVATEIESSSIETAGGSWSYEDRDGATFWTQTNSIALRRNLLVSILRPGLQLALELSTRQAMRKAKRLLEHSSTSNPSW